MSGVGQATGIGRAVDIGAAIVFAGAVGYSILVVTGSEAGAAAAAAAGFLATKLALGRIFDAPVYALADFAVGPIEPFEDDALLLTELAELLLTDAVAEDTRSELLLEDRLELPAGDCRVIRLFDPRTLPSAGEMHQRIEQHLQRAQAAAYPDATAELHRALSDLRGSLRSITR